jgi:hypothetical protein
MSEGTIKVRNVNRAIWSQFVLRCQEEGRDVGEALEAWLRRAIRQQRTITPEAIDTSHKVLRMRRD